MSRKEIEEYAMQITTEKESLQQKLSWYEEQFRLGRAQRFGASSEHISFDQMSLFNEAEAESYEKILKEPEISDVVSTSKKKKKGHKAYITAKFPVETIEYVLSAEDSICEKCGAALTEMKQIVHKELKIVPAQVSVVERVQHVYSCRNCDCNGTYGTIVAASMPKPVLRNSLASPSLLAYVMSRKYVEALPLYRQEQEFKRNGILLSRQTLSNWMVKVSEQYLSKLYKIMHQELLKNQVLHADETVLEVLQEPGRAANCQSYMWLYRSSGDSVPIVLYEYQEGRSGVYPETFLKGFEGYLCCDGYSGYHRLTKPREDGTVAITLVGCFAHARRKWADALKAIDPKNQKTATTIQKGFEFCNQIFHLEKEYVSLSSTERYEKRQTEAKPIVEEYFAWIKKMESMVPHKSQLGNAISYSIRQESYLKNYLLDGRLECSNNRAERSIKPFVIGRKNFLFSNTPKGANASATIYSMVETAKENGLIPFAYLEYVFEKMSNMDLNNEKELKKLLPWSQELPKECKNIFGTN